MRVLVCIPCLMTGGTEIQTLSLVEALVGDGHTVGVACYFEHAPEMADRYRRVGAEVILLSPEGVRPVGIRATIAHLWRGLRGAVKGFRPDAAHVQYMAPGALPVIILKALGVKKIIATTHTP
ncbi:MAG: glycosyltransferase family 4 protein, partial [Bacteroides sp.]|nr:glycosyltransferase family 4 protein [Bacteroides sp.]